MRDTNIQVLKFGSSVLRSEADLPTVVHEIYRWWREGYQVLAVVSALGKTTDQLMQRARSVCLDADDALLASLLATGEAASSALLGIALNRSGIPATVLDAEQAKLRTVGPTLDADPISVDVRKLLSSLRTGIVVLPGFIGRDNEGQTTLLGRGGSDLTALFVAQRLGAQCRLLKDVDGLYTSDPNSNAGPRASRFRQISYRRAADVGGAVVQPKAIEFAERNRLRFVVSSPISSNGTEVGPYVDQIASVTATGRPLRVGLLGCGTVGGGVVQRLAAQPELFEIVSVGTRNIGRTIEAGVPERLITTHLHKILTDRVDVVIELLGGVEPAKTLIHDALEQGCDVVTANKALLASDLSRLEALATAHRAGIRYSAAVGGVAPALETVHRAKAAGPLSSVAGVLNGTTNFILDELSSGRDLPVAIKRAQEFGYTEADPQNDLDGTDAALKLVLLARSAFDVDLPFSRIRRQGLESLDTKTIRIAGQTDKKVRLVAECRRSAAGIEASVMPVELTSSHPLAQVSGVANRVVITAANGRTWVAVGKGAGRWPTTEAVIADLVDLRFDSNNLLTADREEECVA